MFIAAFLLLLTWVPCCGVGLHGPDVRKARAGNRSHVCGSANPNKNVIDLREPSRPGPLRDLTSKELRKLRTFLENDANIRATSPAMARMNSSFIHSADILLPPKPEVLRFLDSGGPRPVRRARVLMFRGDKTPPVVEEYVCQPLPNVKSCRLLNLTSQRNPIEFSYRPSSAAEFASFTQFVLTEMDSRVCYRRKTLSLSDSVTLMRPA